MLRRGMSLIGVMKLLGHTTPRMTLRYIEVTQADLQREFLRARQHPRHLPPPLPGAGAGVASASVLDSLRAALELLDCSRRKYHQPPLDRLRRQLAKLIDRVAKVPPASD